MSREHTYFIKNAKRVEGLRGVTHGLPVGFRTHDHPHEILHWLIPISSRLDGVYDDPLAVIPSREIQFRFYFREIPLQHLSYSPQVFFLALARLRGRMQMQRQALVPGAVLVLEQD